MLSAVVLAFGAVSLRLVLLALDGQGEIAVNISEPLTSSYARPDIIDRNGRLLATDVVAPSLYADPLLIIDRDEVVETLATILPDLNQAELRQQLADRNKRFVWIRRGLSPNVAQRIHDLGLPGLEFRRELKRTYPLGTVAGHVLGAVNIDNRGFSGIERWIDETGKSVAVQGTTLGDLPPVRLSLDLAVQHSLDQELSGAMRDYRAKGAAGLVMDVETGELVGASSLPGIDPLKPAQNLEQARLDKLAGGTFELGSIFKTITIAVALDAGLASPARKLDVSRPLQAGAFTISDKHGGARPLTVAEIFTHSSNVGSGMLALEAGPERMKAFFSRVGLTGQIATEAGPVAPTVSPKHWGRAELITVAYGHGIAVAPLQFAVATAPLVNGGHTVTPTFIAKGEAETLGRQQAVKRSTSDAIVRMMRRNVTDAAGTGKRADIDGYSVGGKTGTAEMAAAGGYKEKSVIASFLATFPTEKPRYLVLVLLFEPQGQPDGLGRQITASVNAAPTAGRIIARIAPALGVEPDGGLAAPRRAAFDGNLAKNYQTR